MKKIITILLTMVLLCSSMIIPSYAAVIEEPEIMPLWDNLDIVTLDIAFSGSEGNASGASTKKDGVSLIEGTVVVYEKINGEWVYLDEAYNSTTRYTVGVSCDFPAHVGGEYYAVFTVTAYRNGVGETFTMDSYRAY